MQYSCPGCLGSGPLPKEHLCVRRGGETGDGVGEILEGVLVVDTVRRQHQLHRPPALAHQALNVLAIAPPQHARFRRPNNRCLTQKDHGKLSYHSLLTY
jgi:hypothetical protein